MPQVVQIQRQPNSWEQGGQSIQQTADNFLKSMLAMGQMQNNNAWRMAEMNLQNQRIADANTRQDKQLAAIDARHKEDLAQRLQMHNDTMSLHRAQMARANAAMNKSQLVTVKGPDGSDMPVLFNPVTQKVTPFTMPGMGGGAGGAMGGGSSIPGLDAATTAGMNEVLSPNWSPTSGGGQQDFGSMYDNGVRAGLLKPLPSMSGVGGGVDTPSPIAPIPTQAEVQLPKVQLNAPSLNYDPTKNTPLSQRPMLEVAKLTGLFPQFSDGVQAGQQPNAQPAASTSPANPITPVGSTPQQPAANTLAPGTVVDGFGNPVQVPDNFSWNKEGQQHFNGVNYYVTSTPNGKYFKIGGAVQLTPAEKKDQRAVEKMDSMDAAAKQSGQNVLGMIQQARNLVGQGNAYGVLPNTGMGSLLNWIPGTTGKDLETTLDTIKANVGFDKLQQMRANSPTGAALGSVSDFENKMLQSVIASLATSQSKEQFLTNLKRVEDTYNRIVHGPNYRGQQPGGISAQPPAGFRLVN